MASKKKLLMSNSKKLMIILDISCQMERNGNHRPVNNALKAPVIFYFSSAQQFFIPPIYATNFQFQYFGDYRQTLRLFPLRISYFNSPEPNLASPLNKKTIETRK
jgi:hypothetical protein